MEIITGYTGKPHVTSEQDRDVNIGVVGKGSYVLQTGMQLAAEVSSNNEIKIRDGVLMHQGCTASIKKNTYDSLIIVNGSQGMKRIDLIVARYEKNQDNGIESLDLKVIQGTPAESTRQFQNIQREIFRLVIMWQTCQCTKLSLMDLILQKSKKCVKSPQILVL